MKTLLPSLLAIAATVPAAETAPKSTLPVRLIDMSLVVMTTAGGSSAKNAELAELQLGGHDPARTGFTFQGAELSLSGAVDPYFTAEAHITASEAHGVELEEGFATTTGLPGGLEAKAGYYLTEFGITNASHAHSWSWLDRPMAAARLLGGEGMRGTGARLDWVAPTSQYLRVGLGVQNPDDATMTSFLGGGHDHGHEEEGEEHAHGLGGLESVEYEPRKARDFLWSTRAVTAFEVSSDATTQVGVSGAFGPNATGPEGRTALYGADVTVRVRTGSGSEGAGDLKAAFEYIGRTAVIAPRSWEEWDGTSPTDAPVGNGTMLEAGDESLRDQGLSAEVTYGVAPRWHIGLRAEWMGGQGDNWHVHELSEEIAEEIEREDLDESPDRSTRTRISPLIAFQPSEFSKLRLQYAYDRAGHLDEPVHSVWLGLEVLLGAHPAHGF